VSVGRVPAVSASGASVVVRRLIVAALHVRHGSANGAPIDVPVVPVAGRGDRWVDALEAFGVSALISGHADELSMVGPAARRLRTMRERSVRAVRCAASDTSLLSYLLHSAGIDHLVVGGPAVANLLSPPSEVGNHVAIRVWVRSCDRHVARAVLESSGWAGHEVLPDVLAHRSRTPIEVVETFATSRHLRGTRFGDEFARSVSVPELGPWVRTVSAELALRAAAERTRSVGWCWIGAVADVAQLAAACSPQELQRVQRHRSVRRALAAAIELAPWLFEVAKVSRWDTAHAQRAFCAWERLPTPRPSHGLVRGAQRGVPMQRGVQPDVYSARS
jgi:hypothetical protein